MDARFTAEQDEIRGALRDLLRRRCGPRELRAAVDTPAGHDPGLWTALAGQLGLPALALPEEYGGVGCSATELALACEETGRVLAPSPLLATAVLAAPLLLALGTQDQRADLLPRIASGTLTATLAAPPATALALTCGNEGEWAGGGRAGGVQARLVRGEGSDTGAAQRPQKAAAVPYRPGRGPGAAASGGPDGVGAVSGGSGAVHGRPGAVPDAAGTASLGPRAVPGGAGAAPGGSGAAPPARDPAPAGSRSAPAVPTSAAPRAAAPRSGWRLYGQVDQVLDGHTAGLLVVAAHAGGFARSRTLLFLVPGDAPGLVRTRQTALDATRPRACIQLRDVEAELLGGDDEADVLGALARLGDTVAAVLACEAVGAADRALERTVEYVGQREQFGRVIGSFQAVKHRLADVYVQLQAARSAAYYAAWAVGQGEQRVGGLALAQALEALRTAAAEGIQLHGGIGFTWEHEAHLYFKRATGDDLLFGPAHRLRAHAADAARLFERTEVSV
ncbi:acyl-CoA dehydrogenase family protein [Streptomyces sp. 351MFTsu5.1]|uniref:acyl-CoA dehydrogenase family protein n=1 Tax=Streptomyces sp. 351MFTsu5.1 TaxID=1172180 RepID=UPI000376D99A|nr:acyl-CoA dehydrogenase family protein [Streptomyces sp. 351MFTsu5.1]